MLDSDSSAMDDASDFPGLLGLGLAGIFRDLPDFFRLRFSPVLRLSVLLMFSAKRSCKEGLFKNSFKNS